MTRSILVPVDGSNCSKQALEYALEHYPDDDVTAFHVISAGTGDLGSFAGMTGDLPDSERMEERAEEVLEEATAIADEHGVDVATRTGRGRPDRAIVALIEDEEYDLVVMGSHGRDNVRKMLLGSVAEKVVRRAPSPVVIVRG